jgi:hypothetical protein
MMGCQPKAEFVFRIQSYFSNWEGVQDRKADAAGRVLIANCGCTECTAIALNWNDLLNSK